LIAKLRQDVVAGYAAAEASAEGLNNAQREFRELTKGEFWATLSAGQKEALRLEVDRKSAAEDLNKQLAVEEAARKRTREASHRFAKQEADEAGKRTAPILEYIANLKEQADTAGMTADELDRYREKLALIKTELPQGSAAMKDYQSEADGYRKKISEAANDGVSGAKSALAEYQKTAGFTAKNVGEVVSKSFKGMEDALTNFVMTGKLQFADLTKSIISDMIKMVIQQQITAPLAGMANTAIKAWFSGGTTASANGNAFDRGNLTAFANGGAFTNQIATRPTVAPMALFGEAGPEAIMPLTRLSNGRLGVQSQGGGGVTNNISIVINSDGTSSEKSDGNTSAKELAQRIRTVVQDVIYQEQRNGGMLARG
jgi:phage-related minor tail protein